MESRKEKRKRLEKEAKQHTFAANAKKTGKVFAVGALTSSAILPGITNLAHAQETQDIVVEEIGEESTLLNEQETITEEVTSEEAPVLEEERGEQEIEVLYPQPDLPLEILDVEEGTEEESILEEAGVDESEIEMGTPNEPVSIAPRVAAFRAVNHQAFIEDIARHAVPVAQRNNLWPSVMIAQAILESGWGQSALSSPPHHNLFGIKGSFRGQSVTMPTLEFFNGQWVTINDAFRSYPSFTESFEDYANLLRTLSFDGGRTFFYAGAWRENTTTPQQATQWLQGRFATDPNYAALLNNLIAQNNLTRFDGVAGGAIGGGTTNVNQPTAPAPPPANTNNNQNVHVVVSGDTLWGVANRFGVTVANLRTWNNLRSDVLQIGQRLNVRAPGNAQAPSTPVAPPPSAPANNNAPQTHTVVAGDTLSALAIRFGTSVANLRAWNNLRSDVILIGQRLNVRAPGNNAPAPTTPPANNNNNNVNNNQTHTVVAGDTLYALARRFGVSVANLRAWNNLRSDLIMVGQRLTVRSGNAAGATVTPPSNNQTQPPASTNAQQTHIVVAGDNLYTLARRNGTTVANLRTWNNLRGDIIQIGQRLIVRNGGAVVNTPPANANNANANNTVTVRSGDSLWALAQSNGTTVANLRQLNNISGDLIFIGQRLRVR